MGLAATRVHASGQQLRKIITLCAAVHTVEDMRSVQELTAGQGNVNRASCTRRHRHTAGRKAQAKTVIPLGQRPWEAQRRHLHSASRPALGNVHCYSLPLAQRPETIRGDVACQEPAPTRRWQHRQRLQCSWQPIQSKPCADESQHNRSVHRRRSTCCTPDRSA